MLFGASFKNMISNKIVIIKNFYLHLSSFKINFDSSGFVNSTAHSDKLLKKRKKNFLETQKKKEKENCGSIKIFTRMIDVHQHFYSQNSSFVAKTEIKLHLAPKSKLLFFCLMKRKFSEKKSTKRNQNKKFFFRFFSLAETPLVSVYQCSLEQLKKKNIPLKKLK
jgi:hypothetical protein